MIQPAKYDINSTTEYAKSVSTCSEGHEPQYPTCGSIASTHTKTERAPCHNMVPQGVESMGDYLPQRPGNNQRCLSFLSLSCSRGTISNTKDLGVTAVTAASRGILRYPTYGNAAATSSETECAPSHNVTPQGFGSTPTIPFLQWPYPQVSTLSVWILLA